MMFACKCNAISMVFSTSFSRYGFTKKPYGWVSFAASKVFLSELAERYIKAIFLSLSTFAISIPVILPLRKISNNTRSGDNSSLVFNASAPERAIGHTSCPAFSNIIWRLFASMNWSSTTSILFFMAYILCQTEVFVTHINPGYVQVQRNGCPIFAFDKQFSIHIR